MAAVKINRIMNDLPPSFKKVSTIAVLMDMKSFIKYSRNMNKDVIQKDMRQIVEDPNGDKELIRICTYLPMALMYENPEMQKYIYDILVETSRVIEGEVFFTKTEFFGAIHLINTLVTGHVTLQTGGGNVTKYLYYFGIVLFAAFCDYWILTNGSWGRISNAIEQVKNVAPIFLEGCDIEHKPSKVAELLARGTKDNKIVYTIDKVMQCLQTPVYVTKKLVEIEERNIAKELIRQFQAELGSIPELKALAPPPTASDSREMVLYGEEIPVHLMSQLQLPLDLTQPKYNKQLKKKLDTLIQLPPNEFRKIIEPSFRSSPTPTPNPKPTFQNAKELISDIYGAAKELGFDTQAPSLDPFNALSWTIQDKIKHLRRTLEFNTFKAKAQVEDFMAEVERMVNDIKSIPRIMSFLIFINSAAFAGILFFIQEMRSSSTQTAMKDEPRVLEHDNEEVDEDDNEDVENVDEEDVDEEDVDEDDVDEDVDEEDLVAQLEKMSPLSTDQERRAAREAARLSEIGGRRRRKRKTLRKQKNKTRKHKRRQKRRPTKGKRARRVTRRY
jgi:hypothetical protein